MKVADYRAMTPDHIVQGQASIVGAQGYGTEVHHGLGITNPDEAEWQAWLINDRHHP